MRIKQTYKMLHFLHYQLRCLESDSKKEINLKHINVEETEVERRSEHTRLKPRQERTKKSLSLARASKLQYLKRQAIPLYASFVFKENEFNKTFITPLEMNWTDLKYLLVAQRRLIIVNYCKYGFGYLIFLKSLRETTRPISFGMYKSQLGAAFGHTVRTIEDYLLQKDDIKKPLTAFQLRHLTDSLFPLKSHFDPPICEIFLKCLKTSYLLETELCSRQQVIELYKMLAEKSKENVELYHMRHNNKKPKTSFEWNQESNILLIQKYLQFKSMKSLTVFFRRKFIKEICLQYFNRTKVLEQLTYIFRIQIHQINEILQKSERTDLVLIRQPEIKKISAQMVYINARVELCRVILGIESNVSKFYYEVEAARKMKKPHIIKTQRDEINRGPDSKAMHQFLYQQTSEDQN